MTLFVEFYDFLSISGEIVVEIWRTRRSSPSSHKNAHIVYEFVRISAVVPVTFVDI